MRNTLATGGYASGATAQAASTGTQLSIWTPTTTPCHISGEWSGHGSGHLGVSRSGYIWDVIAEDMLVDCNLTAEGTTTDLVIHDIGRWMLVIHDVGSSCTRDMPSTKQ